MLRELWLKSHLTIPRKGMETFSTVLFSLWWFLSSHLTIPRKGMETQYLLRVCLSTNLSHLTIPRKGMETLVMNKVNHDVAV